MFPVTCDNASKINVNFAPDGAIDGPLEFAVVSGDGSFEYEGGTDPTKQLTCKAVSGTAVFDSATSDTVGITVIRVTADVQKGAGRETITEDIVLTVSAVPVPNATSLGMSTGAIEPK